MVFINLDIVTWKTLLYFIITILYYFIIITSFMLLYSIVYTIYSITILYIIENYPPQEIHYLFV